MSPNILLYNSFSTAYQFQLNKFKFTKKKNIFELFLQVYKRYFPKKIIFANSKVNMVRNYIKTVPFCGWNTPEKGVKKTNTIGNTG